LLPARTSAGRALLPAWVTGLAFISANLGAIEILGMAANGRSTDGRLCTSTGSSRPGDGLSRGGHDAILLRVPGAERPEYLLRRFNAPTHLFNALTFATSSVLIAGVNLYALGIILQSLLGWPLWAAIVISAIFVLAYITLGGLSGAIYNEVLQFFVILAGLIPIVVIGLVRVGGWSGFKSAVTHTRSAPAPSTPGRARASLVEPAG
jgi:SSS family solute:Na+ symporter